MFRKYSLQVSPNNYKTLEKALIELNKSGKENKDRFGIFKDDRDIIQHLNKILSPNYNNFKHGIKNMSYEKEVWVQGKSIIIREDIFYGMMEDISEI